MKITAKTIKDVLATKHTKDVFISECKTGPSQGYGCPRLDGWAMKRSWANQLSVGYEIKVSRSDFLNDKKWMNYLPYCNEFYFVCPSKLIDVSEVGSGVGLMWISTTGTRIYTKKKSPYRDVIIPEEFYRYILMCRTEIARCEIPIQNERNNNEQFWCDWLKRKDKKLDIGRRVSKKLRQIIAEKIDKVEVKQKVLESKLDSFTDVRKLLKDLGIEEDGLRWFENALNHKIERVQEVVPTNLIYTLNRTLKDLEELRNRLGEVQNQSMDIKEI